MGEVFPPRRSGTLRASLCEHPQNSHICPPRIPHALCLCGFSHRLLQYDERGANSFVCCHFHTSCTLHHLYGCWRWTFCTVKGEIPSTAAVVTVIDAKSASPEDTKRCVVSSSLDRESSFLKATRSKRKNKRKRVFGFLQISCTVIF